jgi:hypothetical protein
LLVTAFSDTRQTIIDGLTKLAKLDFLLRYPALMERLADVLGYEVPERVRPSPEERLAVESRMVRYKYGPWDDRYYPIVGLLLGTGLVQSVSGKGRVALTITDKGQAIARRVAEDQTWRIVADRCEYLAHSFDLSGNRLKDLIYEHLPEIVDRPHRTVI